MKRLSFESLETRELKTVEMGLDFQTVTFDSGTAEAADIGSDFVDSDDGHERKPNQLGT